MRRDNRRNTPIIGQRPQAQIHPLHGLQLHFYPRVHRNVHMRRMASLRVRLRLGFASVGLARLPSRYRSGTPLKLGSGFAIALSCGPLKAK